MDVGAWLRKLGLERYDPAFRENRVTSEILPKLTAEDLKDLGVGLVGDRRLLLEAIADLRERSASAQDSVGRSGEVGSPAATERRQLTVMFCDLVSSTALSGKLDPEDYREVIKSFQIAISDAARKFDGHVAKYLGDGVLVYFGYPQAHEDDADRAVRSSLAALEAVRHLAPQEGGFRLQARIGIATGVVVAGDIAEGGVSETGAISGETPNLAARLQGLAAPGDVVISQHTQRLVAGLFECEDLGLQNLKGITPPINAWRVKGERQSESRFEAQHGAGLTEFVGRGDEVELLLRRWELTKSGEGQVVLISGEPGIGKSRLTQHVRDRLARDPHTRLRYQCSPHHTNSALYPVVSQLSFAAGIAAEETSPAKLDKLEALLARGSTELQPIVPLFADLLSIPYAERYPALDLTPQAQKMRTLEALKDQLLGLARQQPVYFVFEDLHWSDPTTQELLELIVDKIQYAPVLAVMTFRPEYQPRWVGQPHVALLAINRLNQRQCAEMARHVVARAALPASALDAIVQRTDGIPLFVEELTRALLEGGISETIPTTIQGSLLARLDRLGTAKQVAQIGAVIGREFDHALLAAVTPLSGQELDDAIGRLVGSELVFRRGTPPDATYTFKHALVQDAAYESLLKSRRRKIHADIAAALRSQSPVLEVNDPELLAHHYSQAGLADLAVGYWEKAGDRALGRSANLEALRHYRAALALLDALPPEKRPARELALQIGLGGALTAVEGYGAPATGAAYRRAREICLEMRDRKHLFPVLYGLANFYLTVAQYKEAMQVANELVQFAEERGEPGPVLAAQSCLGAVQTFMGSWADGRESLGKCIDLYNVTRDASLTMEYAEDPGVVSYCFNSFCAWNLGHPDQAIKSMNAAALLSQQLKHANSIAHALAMTPWLLYLLGDPKATMSAAEVGLAYAREKSLPYWEAIIGIFEGWALSQLGKVDEAVVTISSAIRLFRGSGGRAANTTMQAVLAEAYRTGGQHEDALRSVEEGLRFAANHSEGISVVELLRLKGLILRDQAPADQDPGEKCLLDALRVARQRKAKSMELRIAIDLAKVWQAHGKSAEAVGLLGPLDESFTEGFGTRDLTEARALLKRPIA